ncbi:hypothetical protein HOA91_01990 [Candidatus Woesearchaeota archaeon]|nr:hypothetical protein [Candidatus Woesearchaeota archaeon]
MAVDTARHLRLLKREEIDLLDNIGIASQHLVEIERLIKEIKSGIPEIIGSSKKIGYTELVSPGRVGELGAHLIEFNHRAKKVFAEGLVFVRDLRKK